MDIMDAVRAEVWATLPEAAWTAPLADLHATVDGVEPDAAEMWEFWCACRDAAAAGEYVPAEAADAAIAALTAAEQMRAVFFIWQVRDALEA
jgi:hypothetical protein